MAAPTTAYITEKGRSGLADSASSMTAVKDVSLAKYIQNTTPTTGEAWGDGYFNASDSLSESDAKIRDIFKLDGFAVMVKGGGEKTFVGFCYSRTSSNGLYHKTERFSGAKVPISTNLEAELLIDGGLNRKPEVNSTATTGNRATADLLNNGFKITAKFRSAFYNATTAHGLKWRLYLSSDPYNSVSIGTIPEGKESSPTTYSAYSVDVDPIDNLYIEAPNTYEVRAYITNEEGTTELHLDNVVVSPAERTFYFGNDIYGAWLYGSSDTYLQTRRKMLGSILYEELVPTPTPVDAGYYVDKVYSETSLGNGYYYVVCNSSGVVTLEGIFSGQLRTTYGHCGYGTTLALALAAADSDADIDISGVHWQSPPYSAYLYSIAYDPNDSKWYNGEAGTIQATDGFYVRGENEFKYYWWQISSGVRVDEGSYGAAEDYEINI